MEKMGLTSLEIYKNKRVLLTGHTGFKGSWMNCWLNILGAKVLGFSLNPNTTPNHFNLLKLNNESAIHDICDLDFLQKTIERFNPEIIFHLAAQPLVRYSYKYPIETYLTNIMGTANVLEAARQNGNIQAIVIITTDKCYENIEQKKGYVETDRMGGFDPYSSSKGCAELIVNAYRNSYFHIDNYNKTHHTLIASARAGNVIGGGDWSQDRLIPDIIKCAVNGETTKIRNPKSTRPWQHVLDPIGGYLMLGEKLLSNKIEFAEGWNFGPEESENLTVEDILNKASNNWDKIKYEVESNIINPHEANLLSLNIDKAKNKLGWVPKWSNDMAIQKTIEWYKSFYLKNEMLSFQQIEEYISN